ncbi:MAG: tetratricopeptide repeat protein [Elusimicrobia bacterium]|nr:tetratricopeptide repeat protein [Elusimicrobiota bacterium]
MRARSGRAGLVVAAAFVFSGCIATQKDILDLSAQMDTLTAQIHTLKKSLSTMQSNQADLAVKLDQMHKETSVLNETIKDAQQSNSKLSSKLDDLGAALGAKFSTIGETLTAQQKKLAELHAEEERLSKENQKLAEENRRKAEEERKKAEEEARKAAQATGPAPSQIYHSAVVQLNQKKYDLAAQGFALYLQKYPKGEVADLATYYLGQALHAQKKREEAARQFALLLDRFPKSDLTPSARLKYAACLIELKSHLEEAQRYLQSIPEDFPASPEAKMAPNLLKELDKLMKKPAAPSKPKR